MVSCDGEGGLLALSVSSVDEHELFRQHLLDKVPWRLTRRRRCSQPGAASGTQSYRSRCKSMTATDLPVRSQSL